MRIDVKTGALHTCKGVVAPGISRKEFLESELGSTSRELIQNKEWIIYSSKLNEDNSEWGINILFKDGLLYELHCSVTAEGDNWSNWSEEKENEKKKKLEKFLQNSLGQPPHLFDWGVAFADLDFKGGSGQAILRYRTLNNG